ncbi:MAG: GNAT family N-acetyltransferase [Pseudomonadota bacterium]
MKVALASAADEKRWNEYVGSHPNSSPYHSYAWKKAMTEAYGLRCNYYLACDKSGAVVGVFPTAQVAGLKRGRLCALPYCDLGAPLANNAVISAALIQAVFDCADYSKVKTIDIRDSLNSPAEDIDPGTKVRMLLPLPETTEALFDGFKSKHRSQIRKAKKNGLTIETGTSPKLVDQFYSVYARNMRDLGSPPHSRSWHRAIVRSFGDSSTVALVKHGEVVLGGGIVLRIGSKAAIPWASTLREFNHLAPNMLLYWELLADSVRMGCTVFDFGRSTYGEGTYRFKAQWGSTPLPLNWQHATLVQGVDAEPALQLTCATSSRRRSSKIALLEKTWRQLPVWLSTSMGSKLRRYIDL